jgi:hypothetical protein
MAVSFKPASAVGARAQRGSSRAAARPSVATRSVRAAAQAPFKAASSSSGAFLKASSRAQSLVAQAAATAGAVAVAGVDAAKINAKPVVVITGAWPGCRRPLQRLVMHAGRQ